MYWDTLSLRVDWPLCVSPAPEVWAGAFRLVLPWSDPWPPLSTCRPLLGRTKTPTGRVLCRLLGCQPHLPVWMCLAAMLVPMATQGSVYHALGSSAYSLRDRWPHNSTVHTERKRAASLSPHRHSVPALGQCLAHSRLSGSVCWQSSKRQKSCLCFFKILN